MRRFDSAPRRFSPVQRWSVATMTTRRERTISATLPGMRIAISAILLLAACHDSDAPKPPASPAASSATTVKPAAPGEAPRSGERDLEAIANQFMIASLHGDRTLARHLMLSYDELVAITTKSIVRAD